ncbi:MAG: DUF169 domain-containing protein [Candidatus Gribaldobacteria bacterium]|nr:DUF169 domain-containing protein [Candidatus Gribaldobacteria bacterium]
MTDNLIKKFKKALGLENEIISVSFVKKLPILHRHYRDTACTALARALLKREKVFFGNQAFGQLCSGAKYFFKTESISDDKACSVYVKDEQVFAKQKVCQDFLKSLPKFPADLQNRFITIEPLLAKSKPSVVVMLVNPAQASRILGLLNYRVYRPIVILPNQPSCIAIFAPLATGQPHCNFIDYYDRYYQGKIKGQKIWPEEKMLISLTAKDFREVLNNLAKSPHGTFRPTLKPQKVDPI